MEVKADRNDLPVDIRQLKTVLLGDLVRRYREEVTPSKEGCAVERVVLDKFLRDPICSLKLSELRTEDFARYRDQRLKVIKATTLKRQLNPIRHLFEVARSEWGLPIRENLVAKLGLQTKSDRRERRLRPGEMERLEGAARVCRNPLIQRIILFAVATGMRRGEILAMRWDDVNIDQRSLVIPKTKNGHPRTIPLSRDALAVLTPLASSNGRIFPMSANGFRLAWERVKARAGIDDLRFHDLRHEAISAFFEKGLSAPEVALISGHRDMTMLFRYSHATRQNILKQFDASEERVIAFLEVNESCHGKPKQNEQQR
ncbi:site-specific integrase [Bradyrhizobium diazoefficiens]